MGPSAADWPGVAEILAGRGGLLQPDREPTGWAKTIQALMPDEAVGTQLSTEARARFLGAFTADAAAASMVRIYARALELNTNDRAAGSPPRG